MRKIKDSGQSTFEKFKSLPSETILENLTPSDLAEIHTLGFDSSKLRRGHASGRPRATSSAQDAVIIKLIQRGFSLRSVAESVGLSTQTITNIHERHEAAKQLSASGELA